MELELGRLLGKPFISFFPIASFFLFLEFEWEVQAGIFNF
jgi:hypothetical protein